MFKLTTILVLIVLVMLSGCTGAEIKPRETIIYKPVKVMIPVACDVNVTCDFSGSGYTPTTKLLKCVIKLKRALEYCKQEPEKPE